MRNMRNEYQVLDGKPEGNLGIYGVIKLEWILEKQGRACGLDSSDLG
jgi:hypothetical protein